MMILHAAFAGDSLLLWAESFDEPNARQNNFADTKTITALAEELGANTSAARPTRKVTVWLPSNGHGPLPSNSTLEPGRLAPWSITAHRVPISNAIHLLAAYADKSVVRT